MPSVTFCVPPSARPVVALLRCRIILRQFVGVGGVELLAEVGLVGTARFPRCRPIGSGPALHFEQHLIQLAWFGAFNHNLKNE